MWSITTWNPSQPVSQPSIGARRHMIKSQPDSDRNRQIVGWFGVVLMTSAAGFWALWGTIEAFHEGWCQPTLAGRCLQTLAYLSPSLALVGLTVVSVRWPRLGSLLLFVVGLIGRFDLSNRCATFRVHFGNAGRDPVVNGGRVLVGATSSNRLGDSNDGCDPLVDCDCLCGRTRRKSNGTTG